MYSCQLLPALKRVFVLSLVFRQWGWQCPSAALAHVQHLIPINKQWHLHSDLAFVILIPLLFEGQEMSSELLLFHLYS